MKSILKSLVVRILGWQVRRLQQKNSFKTIGVVGSYGKTSTKMAIAEVLESEFHVQYQKGNYNDSVTVPLVFFGRKLPSLFNPLSWLIVFIRNERLLKDIYPFDIVVIELGIDAPDQMRKFGKYLKLDYCLITALGPEHMEQFKNLEQVASEELTVQEFSNQIIINKNLCPDKLLKPLSKEHESYKLEYPKKLPLDSWQITFSNDEPTVRIEQRVVSKARMFTLSASVVMAIKLDLKLEEVKKRLSKITVVPGRMNTLRGKKGSTIIDDTYNASPEATILALETLYSYPAKQRIALLGNMNELGKFSEKLHRQIGERCDSGKIDLLVTVGPDANKYLAAAARKKGCRVESFDSPYQAAEVIENNIKDNCVILAKGSQNGVFAEEAVKLLLEEPGDSKYLVRQADTWLAKKQKAFGEGWLDQNL